MAVGGSLPKITFQVGKQPVHSSSAGCLPQVQPTTLLHLMGQEVKSLRRTARCPCTEKKGTSLVCLTSKPERAARRRRFVSSLAYLPSIRNAIIPFAWSRNYFLINEVRCFHFTGFPDCHCKYVCLKCISGKLQIPHTGEIWISRKMKVPFTSPVDHLHMGKTSVSIRTSWAG